MSSIETEIRQAIDTFDIDHARQQLRAALKEPTGELFYLAALVAIDDEQRQEFLKKAIELEPFHKEAYGMLEEIESNQTNYPEIRKPVSVESSKRTETAVPLKEEAKTTLRVIFSPLYDYKDAASKVFNFQKTSSEVYLKLTTSEVISAILGSAIVIFILGSFLKSIIGLNEEDFLIFFNVIFLNEIFQVILFLVFAWINAITLHLPMKWVGGEGDFRQVYRGNVLVMAATMPILLTIIWIMEKGFMIDPSLTRNAGAGTFMYFVGISGKIHNIEKLPKWRRLAAMLIFLLLTVGIGVVGAYLYLTLFSSG